MNVVTLIRTVLNVVGIDDTCCDVLLEVVNYVETDEMKLSEKMVFCIFRTLFYPVTTRSRPVPNLYARERHNQKEKQENKRLSLVAHSYGSKGTKFLFEYTE